VALFSPEIIALRRVRSSTSVRDLPISQHEGVSQPSRDHGKCE